MSTANLPEFAAVYTPLGEPALVKRGEEGYWPLPRKYSVETFNVEHDIAQNVANAMLHGSLFGFHTPVANPDHEVTTLGPEGPSF